MTHPLTFSSKVKGATPLLFLNADHANGFILSIIDAATGTALLGLSGADFKGVAGVAGATSGDRLAVSWTDARALGKAAGQAVRLSVRFRNDIPAPSKPRIVGRLFSFWISKDVCGASDGYVAAGGAGFNSSRDMYGSCTTETPVKIDDGDAVLTAAAPLVVHCENSSDCAKEVQSALDRGPTAGFILIPNTSKGLWQVEPLFIHRGGFTLTLASGVVLLAKKGSFHKADASLLTIEFSSDVTILAHGATVKMRKLDYLPPQYVKAEWRMGVKIMGCNRVSIVGLRVQDAGGDGVYIGSTWQVIPKSHAQNYSSNVLLDGVVADGSWRNGLSVISAINLTDATRSSKIRTGQTHTS